MKPFVYTAVAIALLSHAAPAFAEEEVTKATEQIVGQASDAATGAIANLEKAIQGDTTAMLNLATAYALPAILSLVFLFVGYLFASFIGRIIGNAVSKKVDLTLGKFLNRMIKNVILIMVGIGALGYFGVDVTSFAAVLAAAGFAVGMALQGTLSNFAAGIMLLVFRPFKVDDYVSVAGTEGTVEEIELFTTKLNSVDNRHIIIPNSQIFGNLLENYSRNEIRRVDVSVGTDYDADLRLTRMVLNKVVTSVPGVISEPAPQVYLKELGGSSIDWSLRVWCKSSDYWAVRELVTVSTKEALDANAIGIPYPQLDVNVAGRAISQAA